MRKKGKQEKRSCSPSCTRDEGEKISVFVERLDLFLLI